MYCSYIDHIVFIFNQTKNECVCAMCDSGIEKCTALQSIDATENMFIGVSKHIRSRIRAKLLKIFDNENISRYFD